MNSLQLFFGSFSLWKDAVMVLAVITPVLGLLGVFIVLRKAVFFPLATAQASAAGAVLGFLAADFGLTVFPPVAAALLCGIGVSLYLAGEKKDIVTATAVIYLTATAFILIAGGWIRSDLHDVQGLLFGNAVLVAEKEIWYALCAACFGTGMLFVRWRVWVYTGFDPASARVSGFSPFLNTAFLYSVTAVVIAVAARSVGVVPVFGLMLFPALAGLKIARTIPGALLTSGVTAFVSGVGGFVLSFVFELPAGASMVVMSGLMFLFTLLFHRVIKKI